MFNIGDRVKVKNWEEIDDHLKVKTASGNPHWWTAFKAKNCGCIGTVVDRLYSEAYSCQVYTVHFDGQDNPSRSSFDDESLVAVPDESIKEWNYEIICENGVVVAKLYEDGQLIESGHAHILHDGIKGYAQASSYALKKIYEHLNGGTLTNNISK